MRKIYFAVVLTLVVVLIGFAQGVPQGMNYQAVARDKTGKELTNQQISLQISLYDGQSDSAYFTEIHSVTTNEFGLFSLIIGEGVTQAGSFANIPWGQQEIWMSVSIQTPDQSGYTLLGNSKLYSVPYALYAGSVVTPAEKPGALLNTSSGQCPCNGGITSLSVLYLGPSGVTVRVYNNAALQNSGLVSTFVGVNNGAVLTIQVPPNLGTLQSQTYFEYSAIANPSAVTMVPTVCSSSYNALNPASPGGTWGNISVVSQTDQNGETCTACNVSGMWYVGGNAVLSACDQLGTLTNSDLVFVSNNTPRMTVAAGGDVTVDNNLNVNQGLNVLGNATLNQSTGSTTNNGPFTVANSSATTLTGTLTTDGATQLNNTLTVGGITNLNANLNVNNRQPTNLSGTLTVGREAQLDSNLIVGGNSDLHGFLHVDNESPAVFTGTLQGYEDATFNDHVLITNASINSSSTSTGALVVAGGTGIGQTLYVGGPTYLLNTLSVAGNTDIYGYLHVNNQSPTVLTGTLADSLDATFAHHVTLTNGGIGSTTPYNGALVVAGGVGIGQNLNVEGASTFKGPVNFGSVVTFSDTVNSTSYTNGTVVVDGGVGIALNLNVGGANVNLSHHLSVFGPTDLYSTFTAHQLSYFDQNVTINAVESGSKTEQAAFPLTVEGSNQGILIQVNGLGTAQSANFSNDYIQFTDGFGFAQGAITGETQADLNNDLAYIGQQAELSFMVVLATYSTITAAMQASTTAQNLEAASTQTDIVAKNIACAGIQEAEAVTTEIGDDAATTPCVGLGVCETAPPPSDIAAGVANVIEAGIADGLQASTEALAATDQALATANNALADANVVTAGANLAKASLALTQFNVSKALQIPGIYFKSGSGDYAEWLPKANPAELIYRGDVVGVKGGLISKSTKGAEKLMVVSTMPIVLGNAPPKEKEGNFEKVAFMGQVQVKVIGTADAGDYILSTGGATGFGIAKHQADMTAADYANIVGIAWEGTKAAGINYINTAVGINTNDVAKLAIKQQSQLETQEEEINTLKKQVAEINAALAKGTPVSNGTTPVVTSSPATATVSAPASTTTPIATTPAPVNTDAVPVIPGSKRYLELTREQFDQGIQIVINDCKKKGITPEKSLVLKQLIDDPNFRDQLFIQMHEQQQQDIAKRQELNQQTSHQ